MILHVTQCLELIKMPNILLSFIVPVYNTEIYVKKCLDSIIEGIKICPFKCEIIVINDGSTDNSAQVLSQYNNFTNIRIFSQPNSGVSAARNLGIREARGLYIGFVDSDDDINPTVLSVLLEKLQQNAPDVFEFYYQVISTETNVTKVCSQKIHLVPPKGTGREIFPLLSQNSCFEIIVFSRFYRREFILEKQLFFKPLIASEDCEWILRVFFHAASVTFVDDIFYNYKLARRGSLTSTSSLGKYLSHMKAIDYIYIEEFTHIISNDITNQNFITYMNKLSLAQFYPSFEYLFSNVCNPNKDILEREMLQRNYVLRYEKRTDKKIFYYAYASGILPKNVCSYFYRMRRKLRINT